MKRIITLVVRFERPEEVSSVQECEEFVRDALQTYPGMAPPESPWFELDRESIKVTAFDRV